MNGESDWGVYRERERGSEIIEIIRMDENKNKNKSKRWKINRFLYMPIYLNILSGSLSYVIVIIYFSFIF